MSASASIGILGKKLGMTQIFEDDGTCVPVTVVQAGPCRVLQVKMATAAEHPEGHRTASVNHGKKRGRQSKYIGNPITIGSYINFMLKG